MTTTKSSLAAIVVAMSFSAALVAQSYSESVIYTFPGGAGGSEPLASGVVRDVAGNFYGTTIYGGSHNFGTVFKVDPSGNATILHSFGDAEDGQSPYSGLLLTPSGRLFGTAVAGGIRTSNCTKGCGIVYEIDATGNYRVVHEFSGPDGASPMGALIRDSAGNFYGTTLMGGASNAGTVFKIDNQRKESVLYSFRGESDGGNPYAGLIHDSTGNLYGTTEGGGLGDGTVFKLDSSGHETVVHAFIGNSDGALPQAPLIRAPNGDLFGTTFLGGYPFGVGTVFKIDASGKETILCSLSNGNDGAYGRAPVTRDAQGNLYGAAMQGGVGGILGGIIFKITPQGNFSDIYSFTGGADGGGPTAPLLLDSDGSIYSTTASGGNGNGTVFKLTP